MQKLANMKILQQWLIVLGALTTSEMACSPFALRKKSIKLRTKSSAEENEIRENER